MATFVGRLCIDHGILLMLEDPDWVKVMGPVNSQLFFQGKNEPTLPWDATDEFAELAESDDEFDDPPERGHESFLGKQKLLANGHNESSVSQAKVAVYNESHAQEQRQDELPTGDIGEGALSSLVQSPGGSEPDVDDDDDDSASHDSSEDNARNADTFNMLLTNVAKLVARAFGGWDKIEKTFEIPRQALLQATTDLVDSEKPGDVQEEGDVQKQGDVEKSHKSENLVKTLDSLGYMKMLPKAAPCNFYSAALLHRLVLPNLVDLYINFRGQYGQARQMLEAMLMDMRNLPLLERIFISEPEMEIERVDEDNWCAPLGMVVLPALLARPRMLFIMNECFFEHCLVPVTRIPITPLPGVTSNVRSLHLSVPDEIFKVCPRIFQWEAYTSLHALIASCKELESLTLVEGFQVTIEAEVEIGMFAHQLGETLRSKSMKTLNFLNLSSKRIQQTTSKLFRDEKIRYAIETGPDCVARKFHDLGPCIGTLRGFELLTSLHVQVWHLLGRNYCLEAEYLLYQPDTPATNKDDVVEMRAKYVHHLLPPSLEVIGFTSSIGFLREGTFASRERTLSSMVFYTILSNKNQWMPKLRQMKLPYSFIGASAVGGELRDEWVQEGKRWGVELEMGLDSCVNNYDYSDTWVEKH